MAQSLLRFSCAVSLVVLGACARDVELPPLPEAGSLSGRVLLAEPGRPEKRPVEGAEVRLLGSGHAATTSPAGTFTLPNLELTSGLLLVRAQVDGATRQRLLQLADYGTGVQRRVDLGDIVLGENARVRGRVLRGDVLASGGHAGTTVFVPAGPFTAYTNDDGSFSLDQMPEGPVELYAFRAGYEPATLGVLTLRSGETVDLRDVSLRPASATAPGALRGRLSFLPPADGRGDTAVRLVSSTTSVSGTVADDLRFVVSDIPVGLYRLLVSRSGYGQVEVINVLVVSGSDVDLGELVLTTAPAFDAGTPVEPPDAGQFDAGLPDAGAADAGLGATCQVQADCAQGFWCDRNRCVPLCLVDADCGFGRVCDVAVTRTCLTSCVGQCPAGQTCSAQNVCRSVCDGTFPCPGGQKCSAGQCVPECTMDAECGSPFLGCDFGACRRNGFCQADPDCPREQQCTGGQCAARPTAAGVRPDGGAWSDGGLLFACTQACHCRSGERCHEGFCEADLVPTRFVARDAGGDGLTPATPAGDVRLVMADGGHRVALLANETWDLAAQPLALPSGTRLTGGFTSCSATRWVRDSASRTTLTGVGTGTAGNGAMVTAFASGASQSLSDVELSGLTLRLTGTTRCGNSAGLGARYVNGLTLEDVDADYALGACGSASFTTALRVENSTGVTARRLRVLGVTGGGNAGVRLLEFSGSQGLIEDVVVPRFTSNGVEMKVVSVNAPSGATTLRRLSLGRFTNAPTSTGNIQLAIEACNTVPVTAEDLDIEWPVALSFNGQGDAVLVSDCQNLTLRRVAITSVGHPGSLYDQNYGVYLRNSGGVVSDVRIELPTPPTNARRTAGLQLEGARASFAISDVVIRGSGGSGIDNISGVVGVGFQGIRLDNILTGPLSITRADISLTGNIAPHGVLTHNGVSLGADVSLTDSRIEVEGTNTCGADVIGVYVREAVRLERNVITASRGALTAGLYLATANARVEAYGNSVRVGSSSGSSSCGSRGTASIHGSYGLVIDGSNGGNALRLVGNTIESYGQVGQTGPSLGLACVGANSLEFTSNVVATGRGSDARLLSFLSGGSVTTGGCFSPAMFGSNYWFNGVAGAVSPAERLFDAGVLSSTNVYGGTTTCFAPPVAQSDGGPGFPHFLVAGSPCEDRGVIATSNAGVVMGTDLFGRGRDGGAGPDLGAVEGP